MATSSPTSTKRVGRKFCVEDDISLLKEVFAAGDNPFMMPFTSPVWHRVAQNVALQHPRMEGLAGRGAKERAEKVIRESRSLENWKSKQTGTAEQYGMKEAALVEAISLYEEAQVILQCLCRMYRYVCLILIKFICYLYSQGQKKETAEQARQKQKKEEEMRAQAVEMRNAGFATLKRKKGSGE